MANTVEWRTLVSDSVVSAEMDAEAVLLDVASGTYFGLDPVGTSIWRLLEQGVPEHELCDRLFEEYDAPRDVIAADVATFLARLVEHGLARRIEA